MTCVCMCVLQSQYEYMTHTLASEFCLKIKRPSCRSVKRCVSLRVLDLRRSHITQVYWRSIFMYFSSVSTFCSVRAENVISPHGGPESRETSTGHACFPHILNQNHMVGSALMIFGWLACRASNIQSTQMGTGSIKEKPPLPFTPRAHSQTRHITHVAAILRCLLALADCLDWNKTLARSVCVSLTRVYNRYAPRKQHALVITGKSQLTALCRRLCANWTVIPQAGAQK